MRRTLLLALLLSAGTLSVGAPALHAASQTGSFAAAMFSGTWSSMGMAAVVTKADSAAGSNGHLAIHLPEFLRKGGKADYVLHRQSGNIWTTTDNGLKVTFSLTSENVAKLNLAGNGPDQTLDLPLFRN